MSDMLVVNNLTVAIKQQRLMMTAVDRVSFELRPGETLALLGESGCGKSLTSLALMRLLPGEVYYGKQSQVQYEHQDLLNLPEVAMRHMRGRCIAMIFQEPMTALNPVLTIGEQLAEAFSRNAHHSVKDIREHMVALLTEVELSEPEYRLQQYPHQLSGGQKQRVVIAMALAGRPDVLIADEPTTALDTTTQAQILCLLKRLQQRHQMSMLFITHDMNVVRKVADRVCVMYAGQMVELANVAAFMQAPLHPYAQQLFDALPSRTNRRERLTTIPGTVPAPDAMPDGCRFHPRCAHAFETCRKTPPELQHMPDGRQVRCHLYPERTSLPPLPHVVEPWADSSHEADMILSVSNLSVYFYPKATLLSKPHPPIRAVDNVSFDLKKGRTLALVGESGSGKSTIAKAILCLQTITAGEVQYRGKAIESLSGSSLLAFRKQVQIVFQDPFSSMNPRMTVGDIIAEGMRAHGMSPSLIQARQLALLDLVQLSKTSLNRYPHQFSGGQRQRICIARALATDPEVLICDEPTSALDVSVQAQILNLLKTLQIELGLAYLFITHNIGVVSYIADEVLVMRAGKVVEHGPCDSVLSSPADPYTRLLLSST